MRFPLLSILVLAAGSAHAGTDILCSATVMIEGVSTKVRFTSASTFPCKNCKITGTSEVGVKPANSLRETVFHGRPGGPSRDNWIEYDESFAKIAPTYRLVTIAKIGSHGRTLEGRTRQYFADKTFEAKVFSPILPAGGVKMECLRRITTQSLSAMREFE